MLRRSSPRCTSARVAFVGSIGAAASFAGLTLLALAGAACGSSSSGGAPVVDASAPDAAIEAGPANLPDLVDAGCNSLTTTGALVPFTAVSTSDIPSGRGGSVVDGIYHLTSLTQYNSPDGPSQYQATITVQISGTLWQVVGTSTDHNDYSLSELATFQGATVILSETCLDDTATQTITYTATPTSLTWYATDNGVTTVSTFAKD